VKQKCLSHKASKPFTYKRERPIENELGVTQITKRTPGEQRTLLQPWLALANARSDLAEDDDSSDGRLARQIVATLKVILMVDGRPPFEGFQGMIPPHNRGQLDFGDFAAPFARVELRIEKGLINARLDHRYLDFLDALRGTEAWRIRKCPVCQKFFYASRAKSPRFKSYPIGCPGNCSTALRMRRSRAKWPEYHQQRKIAENERANQLEKRGKKRG
jgi:hypothetical protein